MGLRIATNIASQTVQKNLRATSRVADDQLTQLSSGKRITRASDDAAGLAISKQLEGRTRGLRQATRNANDGISLVQTAEGGLNEISNILIRLRELAVQAASDTVGEKERGLLDMEYHQLTEEVNRIADATTFNGAQVLNGESELGTLDFHVGDSSDQHNKIQFDASGTDARADAIGIDGTGVIDKDDANDSFEILDEAIDIVTGYRANLGSIQARLNSTVNNLESQTINQDSARSVIEDVDVALATSQLASSSVIKQAGIQTLAQANNIPNNALRLIG